MTPLEKIRKGIETEDMQLVADGYNSLSIDEIVYKPKVKQKTAEETRAGWNKSKIQRYSEEDYSEPVTTRTFAGDGEKKIAKSEPFIPKKRPNLWTDSGETPPEYSKKDKAADKKNKGKPITKRQPYKPVNVICYSCGKSYSVNPIHAFGGKFRCDGCNKQ